MPPRTGQSEIETELKIKLSRDDLEKVLRAFVKKERISVVSHKYLPRAYYDTPELDLHHNGLSLRVQYKPGHSGRLGGYEQTVKLEILSAAALVRKECKNGLATHEPSFAAVTDAEARAALKPFKNKKLTHIFTAAIERRFFDMDVPGGRVEVAFDVGRIILAGGAKSQSFSEIEIEVKQGKVDLVEALKNEVLKLAPSARVQTLSKAAQGSRLYLKHCQKLS